MQLHCSLDLCQKCNIFNWFANHLLYIDHGNTKFSNIYTIKMRTSSLWKTWRWNAMLIYTIQKIIKTTIIKTRTGYPKFLISSKWNNFICYITKTFVLCTLNCIASFNFFKFFRFKQSINTLEFKSSASALYCFQICKKIARESNILAILYFYRVIIIFKLILQWVLLVTGLTKLEIFVHICPVSIIFFLETFYKLKALYYYVLLYCQKAIKASLSSSRSKSNVRMFCYHVIKMNEV